MMKGPASRLLREGTLRTRRRSWRRNRSGAGNPGRPPVMSESFNRAIDFSLTMFG